MRKKKPLVIPLLGKKHSQSSPSIVGEWFYARKNTSIRALVVSTAKNQITLESDHSTFKVSLKTFVREWVNAKMKRNPKPLTPKRAFGLGWSKGKIDLNS